MIRTLHDLALGTAIAASLLAAPVALAQTAPPQDGNANTSVNGHTTFQADNGTIVTVRSHHPDQKSMQPPPAFATLDTNGNGSIDASEVNQYSPLANDFKYADSNRDNVISRAEYERWVKQP